MRTSLSSSSSIIKRIVLDGLLVTVALMLSYIEVIIPLSSVIMLPGFKLGLANIVVAYAIFCISPSDGAAISVCRILISAVLFSGAVQMAFSLSGAIMSFAAMLLVRYIFPFKVSWIGINTFAAVAHNIGQLIVAIIVMGIGVISYAPWLIAVAVISGIITGSIMCLSVGRINKAIG